ncbi:OmpA family protein [Altererythrobacter sp. MF3-039]|uniref:OmpA family protein n=1 Tax=Altererythrobacter sp. MF3-039 TaxID=3252901 RepID=UPI00390C92B6
MSVLTRPAVAMAALVAAMPVTAWAQGDADALLAMDVSSLRGEIQQRYDAALGVSTDGAVIAADDNRYMWANEAKVQCGIALGFLKSRTKDEVSIRKCVLASQLMYVTPPPPPPPPPPPAPVVCDRELAGTVFFDFDKAEVPASASQTLDFVNERAAACNWSQLDVVGHTDRSGSDAYNEGLSQARANAVADFLVSMGIDRSNIATSWKGESEPRVPTVDGERNPQNRRVEITAK